MDKSKLIVWMNKLEIRLKQKKKYFIPFMLSRKNIKEDFEKLTDQNNLV